ncbi:hypothetical protein B0H11DRAFT_2377094 [Mycena galericulata]|nr:hypothetical protein B0H11DRAFT_2377094 [Mycena galericulata]
MARELVKGLRGREGNETAMGRKHRSNRSGRGHAVPGRKFRLGLSPTAKPPRSFPGTVSPPRRLFPRKNLPSENALAPTLHVVGWVAPCGVGGHGQLDMATGSQWYSQAVVNHLMHLKTLIGVEPSRQASACVIRSIRTTREQPVDRVRVLRVRVRVDPYPYPYPCPTLVWRPCDQSQTLVSVKMNIENRPNLDPPISI